LTITGGATATTGDTTPTISGTSDAIGQTVAVGVAGETTLWSATVLADGTWSVVVGPLTAGDHAVGAGVRNALLTPTVTSQTLTVDVTAPALTIVGGAAVLTKDSTPTISGTSDAIGRVVTVVVDEGTAGVQTLTATVSSAGTWSVTAATLLDAGHTVTASVADAVGNPATATQTLTTDTTAPALTITGGGTATTGDTTPTVSGTSDEIGKTVTVTVGSVTRTAVVGSDGVWSVTLPTLPAGVNTVSAAVTDTAGNTTTVTQSLTVDSSLPLLSINGGASQTTADITPAISGTSDEIGATVTVVVDEGTGSEQTVTAVVAADGTWSVEPTVLTEGVHTVSASVADTAGNPATATQTLTTDTTAPTLTINGGELLTTADSTPTISGTSDAIGRTVSVTVDGRTLTATVTAGGTWSVTSATLTAGDYTVTAKVDDRVGNETTETQTLTVDLNAPTLSIDGGSTASTTSSTPTVTGKSNAVGRTVTVTVAGQTLTTVVEADGTWSVGVAEIIRGTYTVSATVTDALARTVSAYQNLAYPSAPAVIFNTTKAQTVQRGDGDPITVTGNGFRAGESVEIWLHSTPVKLGTLTANATGFITGVVNDTKSTPLGIHHIVLTGLVSGTSADSFDITVEAGAKTLPFTGFEALGWFLVALLALLLGAMAVLIAKLRRRTGES
jgi:acyl-CoA hydrolase